MTDRKKECLCETFKENDWHSERKREDGRGGGEEDREFIDHLTVKKRGKCCNPFPFVKLLPNFPLD